MAYDESNLNMPSLFGKSRLFDSTQERNEYLELAVIIAMGK